MSLFHRTIATYWWRILFFTLTYTHISFYIIVDTVAEQIVYRPLLELLSWDHVVECLRFMSRFHRWCLIFVKVTITWFNPNMRRGTRSPSVWIMACPWSEPSHYLSSRWLIVNLTNRNKIQWNSKTHSQVFIEVKRCLLDNTPINGRKSEMAYPDSKLH